jgi:hypothetical protein
MTTTTITGGSNSNGVLPHCVGNGFQLGDAGSGSGSFANGSITAGATAIGTNNIEALSYASNGFPMLNLTACFVFALAGTVAQTAISSISWTDAGGSNTLNAAAATFDTTSFPGFSYWAWPLTNQNLGGVSTTFTVNIPTLPYSAPTALNVVNDQYNTVTFQWTDAVPSGGSGLPPPQYLIYRDSSLIGTSVSPSYTDSTVALNTTYSYTVAAGDGLGNAVSSRSVVLPVTTPARPVISLSGKFPASNGLQAVAANAFPPVVVAALGLVKPRVYPPHENTTVTSK